VTEVRKYAAELRVGDIWTKRTQHRGARSYRVIAIEPGLGPTLKHPLIFSAT